MSSSAVPPDSSISPTPSVGPDPETYVEAFARGLAVIRAFDAEHPVLTLSEVSERTQISRAAARRLLSTLVYLGYVYLSLGPAITGNRRALRGRCRGAYR
jgi:hypothetical protein